MSTGSDEGLRAPRKPIPEVIWHDLECGSESVDLPVWAELAEAAGGPVIELGCGTGRVGLHLARLGHQVIGIDRNPALVSAFNDRAARDRLSAQALAVDVRDLHLRRLFRLAIAPMQFIQIGDLPDRLAALRTIAEHVGRGGRAAFAIVESGDAFAAAQGPITPEPLPDQRDIDDWMFSSRPVSVQPAGRGIAIARLRQSVSPEGEVLSENHADYLDSIDSGRLEEEAGMAGLRPVERRRLGPGYSQTPSTIVIFEPH